MILQVHVKLMIPWQEGQEQKSYLQVIVKVVRLKRRLVWHNGFLCANNITILFIRTECFMNHAEAIMVEVLSLKRWIMDQVLEYLVEQHNYASAKKKGALKRVILFLYYPDLYPCVPCSQ